MEVIRKGDVLENKYRIDRMLGVGGMSYVVAASHMHLGGNVALKIMRPEAAKNIEFVRRFLREARAMAKLKNEHIARVSDVGTLANGLPYFVMEYLEGESLFSILEKRGAFSVTEASDYVMQACGAIDEAHAAGIVHRDLKPENLFLTRRHNGAPLIKVLDFGISKVQVPSDDERSLTRQGSLMGSLLYTAPEQLRSAKDATTRSDIWSLGVILYELVSGRVPFNGKSVAAMLVLAATKPLSLDAFRKGLPPGFSTLVNWCLEYDQTRRCPNIESLVRGLSNFTQIEP